jgi:hypothetical protein
LLSTHQPPPWRPCAHRQRRRGQTRWPRRSSASYPEVRVSELNCRIVYVLISRDLIKTPCAPACINFDIKQVLRLVCMRMYTCPVCVAHTIHYRTVGGQLLRARFRIVAPMLVLPRIVSGKWYNPYPCPYLLTPRVPSPTTL